MWIREQRSERGLDHGALVDGADAGGNDDAHLRQAALLLLDELVVSGVPTEAGRERVFEQVVEAAPPMKVKVTPSLVSFS